MALLARGLASVLLSAVISDAFRVRPKKRSGSSSTESVAAERASGYVKSLYTWGAPSVLDDGPLRDPRTGGCWDGLRIVTINTDPWSVAFDWEIDVVTTIAEQVGYWHSHQGRVFLSNNSETFPHSCNEDRDEWGRFDVGLHSSSVYEARADLLSGEARILTKYFVVASYRQAWEAANIISPSGYKLVASSEWDDKETHLYQHPSSKDCVLSWQGTTSERMLDWWDNIRFYDVHFCGAGDNVHGGFVDQLRTILDTQSFKSNIQSKLPKCNDLTVVGHSLGGALAALYSYCLNKGSAGGSDYDRVKFTKSTPAVLPPLY